VVSADKHYGVGVTALEAEQELKDLNAARATIDIVPEEYEATPGRRPPTGPEES